jgi:DNA-binding transcriptional LysR family regulator
MVVENLFDDDIVAVTAMQNPWTRRRRIDLAELVNEPWTLPSHDTGIGAFAMDAFRARGLKPPRTTVVTYSTHMRDKLLATGRFLTMLSSYALMLPRRHPSLKALPVELANARGTIAIITLKNRTLSPLAELFIKTTRAVVRPLVRAT